MMTMISKSSALQTVLGCRLGGRSSTLTSSIATAAAVCSWFHSSRVVDEAADNNDKSWMDPAARQYKYWNRETCKDSGAYSYLIDISPESIKREAKILSLSAPDDDANKALHSSSAKLPLGSKLLAVGTELADFDMHRNSKPNVLFVSPSCPRAATTVPLVLAAFPTIQWVHVRSAGIDFVESEAFATITKANNIPVTNAKGQFSSSLAEYALLACSYFAKDIGRLVRQQQARTWANYDIQELRGKTLGIVGYGDIGRACAKLATQYGMRIVALRRHPYLSLDDPYCNVVYGRDKKSLNRLMSESDYIICSAPSTVETRGMVNADAFDAAKENAVFINLVRRCRSLSLSVTHFRRVVSYKNNFTFDLLLFLLGPWSRCGTSSLSFLSFTHLRLLYLAKNLMLLFSSI